MDNPPPVLPANQRVKMTERLWSEEVARADPTPEDTTVYVWSNGRKFVAPKVPA